MKKLAIVALFPLVVGCASLSAPINKAGDSISEGVDMAADFVEKAVEVGLADNLRRAGDGLAALVKALGSLVDFGDESAE